MNPFDDVDDPEEQERLIDPIDQLLSTEINPVMPVPMDQSLGPVPPPGEPFGIPAATPEEFICLRECRHYFETTMVMGVGNTRDSLDSEPILIKRSCRRIPGYDFDLTDECIRDCNDFDPLDKTFVDERELRRQAYYAAHPGVKPYKKPNGSNGGI